MHTEKKPLDAKCVNVKKNILDFPGLHAERPWEGNRFAADDGEGTWQAAAPSGGYGRPYSQPENQRTDQGPKHLTAWHWGNK